MCYGSRVADGGMAEGGAEPGSEGWRRERVPRLPGKDAEGALHGLKALARGPRLAAPSLWPISRHLTIEHRATSVIVRLPRRCCCGPGSRQCGLRIPCHRLGAPADAK